MDGCQTPQSAYSRDVAACKQTLSKQNMRNAEGCLWRSRRNRLKAELPGYSHAQRSGARTAIV